MSSPLPSMLWLFAMPGMSAGRGGVGGRCGGKRSLQIRPQVFDVLASDAQPQEPGGCVLLERPAGATVDQRLDAAEARPVDDQAAGAAEPLGRGLPAREFEREDGAEA